MPDLIGHLFPCCMYRNTALQCVPTVHTDWVWCIEYGTDGCFNCGPDRASLSLAQVLAMDGAGPHDERRKNPHWLVQVLKCYRNLRRVSVIYAF